MGVPGKLGSNARTLAKDTHSRAPLAMAAECWPSKANANEPTRRAAWEMPPTYPLAMTVIVNDQPRDLPDRASIAELLKDMGLQQAACAVEVNRVLVPKAQHQSKVLESGDRIEVVTLVGGG